MSAEKPEHRKAKGANNREADAESRTPDPDNPPPIRTRRVLKGPRRRGWNLFGRRAKE
jgi:hypothetical protein